MQKRIPCAVTNLTMPLQADLRAAKARSLADQDDPPLGDGSALFCTKYKKVSVQSIKCSFAECEMFLYKAQKVFCEDYKMFLHRVQNK